MHSLLFFLSTLVAIPLAATPSEETADHASQLVPFRPFTGRVTRDKVRLRLEPSLDCPVIKTLKSGDLLVIRDEQGDFYAVQPPEETRGYIYRTLVLDGVVEGANVNVRLEPNLDAPIIAQLQRGDRIVGTVAHNNSKWLEVSPPPEAHFYVNKNYIERVGEADLMATLAKKRAEVQTLLSRGDLLAQEELNKPFHSIDLEPVATLYRNVIDGYGEFPTEVARAESALKVIQESYLKKKVDFLEEQHAKQWQNGALVAEEATTALAPSHTGVQERPPSEKMSQWLPVEEAYYQAWCRSYGLCTREECYQAQLAQAVTLTGIVEPYRNIKNRPGDYLLFNERHQPIAYLYSTKVSLHDFVGKQVAIKAARRPNNQFAFPAYFVLTVD